MIVSENRQLIRWIIVLLSFIIISLILWNTYMFFQNFKSEERTKMEIWSFAQQNLIESETDDEIVLTSKIIESNTSTPMLLLNNEQQIIGGNNVDEEKLADSIYTKKLLEKFKYENKPIEVRFNGELFSTIYYGNSPLLNKLKYYPLALLLIIILFAAVVYFFYRSSKNAQQNKLWSGMAKESAHQIGTPLSSLIGWAEILKSENVNPQYISEIEKDINRLQTITDRFSKIGSVPIMEPADIVQETIKSFDYLKARLSKLVDFEIEIPKQPVTVNLNKQLYSWVIENLVKNGIDAMKGKGKLKIEIVDSEKQVYVNVSDSGKGIPRYQFRKIFEPGFTTKKRGWGLGLSLAKRIIEDYHKGRIKVLSSEVDKGTTMQIVLKKIV